jgi:hypothetical protein
VTTGAAVTGPTRAKRMMERPMESSAYLRAEIRTTVGLLGRERTPGLGAFATEATVVPQPDH